MKYLVFLVEERSMATVINGLMPRLFPGVIFQCLEHDGKKDLVSRLENRLRSWRTPGVQFVVLIDNDRGDCVALKRELEAKCQAAERPDTLIRIVCQELEAWYLGEPDALADAFGDERLRSIGRRARFRDPDAVPYPSVALSELLPDANKAIAAGIMSALLTRERNESTSFQALLTGLDRVLG